MPGIGVLLVIVANAALLVAALAVVAYLQYGTRGADDRADWYAETVSLAREVERTVSDADQTLERDSLQRELVPLSTRLKSHARSAPADVDDGAVRDLHELGVTCYRVGMEHTEHRALRTGEFLEEKLDALREQASEVERTAESRR